LTTARSEERRAFESTTPEQSIGSDAQGLAGFTAVAFDLDGTLADTLPAMEASWNEVVAPLIGRPIPREEIVARLGPRLVEIMRTYLTEDVDALCERLSDSFQAANVRHSRLYPGVRELIDELVSRRFALAIVTSMDRASAIPLLEHLGVWQAFSVVVGEEDVPRLKPAPEPVLMAAETLGVDPMNLLMIGDNPTDMQAARAAGAAGGAAMWGFYGEKAAPYATWVFEHPSDALEVLA
jgi:phosphoglycolate phosphatase